LLHDIGKYSDEFQARLAGDPSQVDHSTAGAQLARQTSSKAGHLLAAGIAGHHAGLANGTGGGERTPLLDRLSVAVPDYSAWRHEITLPALTMPRLAPHPTAWEARVGFQFAHLARMIFSSLTDADFLDTEAFYSQREGWPVEREGWHGLDVLRDRLAEYMAELSSKAKPSPLNALRAEILAAARKAAKRPQGIFTLTVPTGGGKTLASLSFGLDHAIEHSLDRVIYVIPYTSIIEQTAAVFREALGPYADHVLEHHSSYRDTGPREGRLKLQLATENWNAPIVVTTAVQFFESLFSDRPSQCRKLHNIANSVVILDEAQTLPLPLLMPCVAVLDELARNYRTTVVLCTARQPALIERPNNPKRSFVGGFEDRLEREIAPNPERLYRASPGARRAGLPAAEDAELPGLLRATPARRPGGPAARRRRCPYR
jgi:CRISPR-associated endonuclease/helicase Cas3